MKKQTQTNTQKNTLALMPPKQDTAPHEEYYTEEWLEWTRAIRALNDAFRLSFTSTELYVSPDLLKLSIDDQSGILDRVKNYRNFNETNDPLMVHNQGFFRLGNTRVVWVIHYYQEAETPLRQLNPVNIDLTQRMLLIMTAEEWWEDLPKNIF